MGGIFTPELLTSETYTMPAVGGTTPFSKTFEGINHVTEDGKNRYLAGVLVFDHGQIIESVVAADLPKENLQNHWTEMSMLGQGHEWLSGDIRGLDIYTANSLDGHVRSSNDTYFEQADIDSSDANGAAVDVWHTMVLSPCAKMRPAQLGKVKGELDGLWPLSKMRAKGKIQANLNGLAGNWVGSGSQQIDIVLIVYETKDKIISCPWRMESVDSEVSNPILSDTLSKVDMVFVRDADDGAFTLPTAQFQTTVGKYQLFSELDGALHNAVYQFNKEDTVNSLVTDGVLVILDPADHASFLKAPKITEHKRLIVKNAGAAHVAGGGTPRYVFRIWVELSANQQASMLRAVGYKGSFADLRSLLKVNRNMSAQALKPSETLGLTLKAA